MEGQYPRRFSVRLKDFDYSHARLYFLTTCIAWSRLPLFGEIKAGKLQLNAMWQDRLRTRV